MILDGTLGEGDPLPSVRTVAAETRVNPLTVLKAYQQLADAGIVESRRGLGMFVNAGAKAARGGGRARALCAMIGRASAPPLTVWASPVPRHC